MLHEMTVRVRQGRMWLERRCRSRARGILERCRARFACGASETYQCPEFWTRLRGRRWRAREALRGLRAGRFRTKGESEKFSRRLTLRAAVDYIDRELECAIPDNDAVQLRIHKAALLHELGDWQAVDKTCREVPAAVRPRDDEFRLFWGHAQFELGQLDESARQLEAIGSTLPPALEKIRLSIVRAYHESAPLDGKAFAKRFNQGGEFHALAKELREWYGVNGLDAVDEAVVEELLNAVQGALDRLSPLDGMAITHDDYRGINDPESERLVFTSGFGWSGSGAVADYLKGIKGITEASKREVVWTQGRSRNPMTSIRGLLATGEIDIPTLRSFLLSGVLGVDVNTRSAKDYAREQVVFNHSVVGQMTRTGVGSRKILKHVRALVDDLGEAVTPQALVQALGRASSGLLLASGKRSHRKVVDNGVMAQNIWLANLFPDARFVIVKRDARDQFCARAMESRAGISADRFVAVQARAIEAFNTAISHVCNRDRVAVVTFEDFVGYSEVREKVRDFVDERLEYAAHGGSRFDASVSAQNVGIYRQWPDEADIRMVERAEFDKAYDFRGLTMIAPGAEPRTIEAEGASAGYDVDGRAT